MRKYFEIKYNNLPYPGAKQSQISQTVTNFQGSIFEPVAGYHALTQTCKERQAKSFPYNNFQDVKKKIGRKPIFICILYCSITNLFWSVLMFCNFNSSDCPVRFLYIHLYCAHSIKCTQAHNKIIIKILKFYNRKIYSNQNKVVSRWALNIC